MTEIIYSPLGMISHMLFRTFVDLYIFPKGYVSVQGTRFFLFWNA